VTDLAIYAGKQSTRELMVSDQFFLKTTVAMHNSPEPQRGPAGRRRPLARSGSVISWLVHPLRIVRRVGRRNCSWLLCLLCVIFEWL